jgi:hypothetical protein
MFVRPGLKSLPGTNAPTQYENSEITDVKSFITLAPDFEGHNIVLTLIH